MRHELSDPLALDVMVGAKKLAANPVAKNSRRVTFDEDIIVAPTFPLGLEIILNAHYEPGLRSLKISRFKSDKSSSLPVGATSIRTPPTGAPLTEAEGAGLGPVRLLMLG
jgi:hypothetical protein